MDPETYRKRMLTQLRKALEDARTTVGEAYAELDLANSLTDHQKNAIRQDVEVERLADALIELGGQMRDWSRPVLRKNELTMVQKLRKVLGYTYP